jgi:hypothetical protein
MIPDPVLLQLFQDGVRTGYISTGTTGDTGQDNCSAWTSDSASERGSTILLINFWEAILPPGINTLPWSGQVFGCDAALHVWCVQD